ncbi:MAG TPA: DUF4340 domain-containing protein, partial [Gemmataceae bacterium]|nr:DUF4340 domain-containing protein [Gemmataceae bacterium]
DKDHWKLEEPYEAAPDGRLVESVVNDVVNARTVTKGADLTSNPGQFDLDRPPLSMTLSAGDKTATVNFGKVSLGSGDSKLVYANTSAQRSPMAVKKSSLGGLFRDVPDAKTAGDLVKSVSAFRAPDLLLANHAFDAINVVQSVDLKGDKSEVQLSKTSAGTWQFEKPAGFGEADVEGDMSGAGSDAAPSGVKPLLSALPQIRANSADDFIEDVTDFKQYGLDPPVGPRIEVVLQGKGESAAPVTEIVTVGKKEDKGDKVFVRSGKERAVAKVSASAIDPIRKVIENPAALRSRALLPGGTVGIDALDIRVGGDPPIELRKLTEGWKLYGPPGEPKAANAQAVQELLNQLGNHRLIREFPDPKLSDADKGLDKPSAVVTVWVNGIEQPKPEEKKDTKGGEAQQAPPPKSAEPNDKAAEPPEPKDKAAKPPEKKDEKKEEKKEPAKPKLKQPTATLTFGKRDKDLLYVRREMGGTKADFAVPEALLPLLTRGRLDYLDVTLPSFTTDQATKLTFTHAGETWVVEKETKDKAAPTWVIRQPANLAGRPAETFKITALLGDLAGLRPVRLWAEKATDRELERFGLKTPRVSATVALSDPKTKELIYLFGAETDDKVHVYAKQAAHDLVFSVPKSSLEAFENANVVDLTVFRLDLSKVTGVKLTGWANLNVERKPQTLDLERKGANNWTVKAPPAFKLSASQAESLLAALADVKAEKFVVFKTGPKPEYKLAPADGALTIEIVEDGQKEPITLTIGGEAEAGKSYDAQSNKSPGDVFLVPKERFEKYKSNPNAFAAE